MNFKTPKPFLSYEEQIDNLINKKHLIINDTSFALLKLHDICYYTLIDGYKNLFYNNMTRQYEPNTTFEDILALYNFDRELRLLIFKYICIIEQRIRSLISYNFCKTYSENQSDYLNHNNYNNTKINQKNINRLIHILKTEANLSTEHPYVVYQRKQYNNVPLWVILNTLTFGQTSKMYSLFKPNIQTKISKNFSNINEKELSQYLKVLTHFRNICAHNERLFSFNSRFQIPDTPLHNKLKIPRKGNQYICGKSDLFSLFISFRYLLPKEDFLSFKKQFSNLLTSFSKHSTPIQKQKLLIAMGFPKNWNNISRYKL